MTDEEKKQLEEFEKEQEEKKNGKEKEEAKVVEVPKKEEPQQAEPLQTEQKEEKKEKKKENVVVEDKQKEKSLKKLQGIKVKVPTLLISIKSLAALLKAGIPLSETIETISGQSSDENLNSIYTYISQEVKKGISLATAMRLFPKVFPETVASVVEAGEKGGSLEKNLIFVAETIQKEWEINKKLKGAVIYPVIIVGMTMVEFLGMIFIILPKLEVMFEAFENIPAFTLFIMNVAKFIRINWMVIFGIIFVLIIGLVIFLRTKPGKKFTGWLAINFPILKKLFTANILSSFSRTLSVLLASGIPLERSMEITSSTTSNFIYADILKKVHDGIQHGKDLSISLGEYPKYFNASFVKMIDIGEVSGSLEENLMYLHEFYTEEVTEMSNNIVTFIEPLLLILVGLIIGGLGITVLMPIYQLMGTING
ncbi:MAG TPA: type II secretion system F family protein [Candidatus Dojkabacteria bacterium]|jgi:type IV pilus assembly protein PilC|nr:type II secretion system F family protein [Candidatus Dojkabacteria bacterium]